MDVRRNKIYLLFFLFLICWQHQANGQDNVIVRSGFFQDSIKIGDQTGFYLTAQYPSTLNVVFPDSTYNFTPFEYERRIYFPTKTSGGKSYDSVVYYLSTFEVDAKQSLSLPVFQLNPMDCTSYSSTRDTIRLTEMVKNLPDTLTAQRLPLKVSTAYENVSYLFNYPILAIVLAALLNVAIIVWVVFGKKIRKHFKLKKMLKAHQKFLAEYAAQVENVKVAFSSLTTENAVSQWKKYMEQLERRPYTRLTTLETAKLENNDSLARNLRAIDGAIYGHNTSVIESLENLKLEADRRFERKLQEVKRG